MSAGTCLAGRRGAHDTRIVITLRRAVASAVACALVALGAATTPITEHLADADVACGSVFAHAQATNAVPSTASTPGHAATAASDACPGSLYDGHRDIALAFVGATALLALVAIRTGYRRRRLHPSLGAL